MRKTLTAPSEILETIHKAQRIAVMSHMAADGDALGSILALVHALRGIGKQAIALCNDPPSSLYSFLPGLEELILPGNPLPFQPELCIAVDLSDIPRLDAWADTFRSAPVSMCIDHHETEEPMGDIFWVDHTIAAACEMVYAVIRGLEAPVTEAIALYIYVGICTDTGNFNYSNTTGSVLRVAAKLVEAGVDVAEITRELYRFRSLPRVKILGRAIESLTLDRGIATMLLNENDFTHCLATDADAEGAINYAIETQGALVAILVKQSGEASKISMRSLGHINVAKVAAKLGGGGHERASGAVVSDPPEEALRRAVAAVREELDELEIDR